MRTCLLLAVGLALASCSTTKPKPVPMAAEHMYTESQKADTSRTNVRPAYMLPKPLSGVAHRTFLDKLLNRAPLTDINVAQLPGKIRKVKGNLTINYAQGNQTNQQVDKKGQLLGDGASVKGDTKAKGNAAVSQDSSTQNALTGTGNQSAIKGNNNATTQTKQDTSKEAAGPLAVLADNATSWLPWVIGAVAVGCVGYGIYYFWFLIPRRKSAANQA